MPPTSRRIERINELIRAEISKLIATKMKAPQLKGLISITEVMTTADLHRAKVFVSILDEEGERQRTFAVLKRAEGFFRKSLAERLNLRYTPEIDLCLDESIERAARIMSLLRELEEK